MMAKPIGSDGKEWDLYTDKGTAYGYIYVKAKLSGWNPEKKQARIIKRIHVGRLFGDGSVKLSEKFLGLFPQFSKETFYYCENQLFTKEEYLALNPDAEPSAPDAEAPRRSAPKGDDAVLDEEPEKCAVTQAGIPWAAWMTLERTGIIRDLKEVFGEEDGRRLADLAVYVFDGGISMQNQEEWAARTALPGLIAMDGRRISELLARVTQKKTDSYYRRRFERTKAQAAERRRLLQAENPGDCIPPLAVAFDSTSFPTYSKTIAHAEYGHAKQNPELAQVNLATVCDQETGDVVYAYEYAGSVNDKASFAPILDRMKDEGFDLSDILLVADRGYKSVYNTQRLINEQISFVQGLPLDGDCVRKAIRKHRAKLYEKRYYQPSAGCSVCTPNDAEKWARSTETGTVDARVFLHLYYSESVSADETHALASKIESLCETMNEGKKPDPELWRKARRFVKKDQSKKKVPGEDGKTVEITVENWIRDDKAFENALEFAGYFAIRSNVIASGLQALTLYRDRQMIEQGFRQFKAGNDCTRMQATESAYAGKLFVYQLAQAIRMSMQMTARRNAESSQVKMPGNSLDKLLATLKSVSALRMGESRLWRVAVMTKKQRDYFSLLGVLPPKGRLQLL